MSEYANYIEQAAYEDGLAKGRAENKDCICKGNWQIIVNESKHLIDKRFRHIDTGEIVVFFGIVWGSDDFYYGVYDSNNHIQLLSCVCDLETHGYELEDKVKTPAEMLRDVYDRQQDMDWFKQEILRQAWEDYSPIEHRVNMIWECEKSPFGYCAYHAFDDPAWDNCLFCGEPYERK